MRLLSVLVLLALGALLGGAALADDKSECLSGIDLIKKELAKAPRGPKMKRLKSALDAAELESFEGDWRECLGALEPAKKVLGTQIRE